MDWLNWLVENWYVIVVIVVCLGGIYVAITDKKKVKAWLEWAVSMAEKELGSGTGQLKLRQVYDMFIERFPVFSKFVSFSLFSQWVDDALDFLREQLEKNEKLKQFIEK